ncbi:amidohydrolase family protein [Nocardia sp. GCM10030253]|uniref:amidohydrolase family protein n=1 Tax=Nocardia sp. GCM10030253 TaxID=3273404 RepID=UPI00363277F3
MSSTLLLRGGIVLDTEPRPRVTEHTDVLIEDGRIVALGTGLSAPEVLDVSGHIVLPGFVDTHRHTWQAAIGATTADATLGDYLARVLGGYAPRYRPADVRIGNLAGALDALGSGTTTLLDWSQLNATAAHTEAAIQGLQESGIRGVFAYGGVAPAAVAPRLTFAYAAMGPEIAGADEAIREWRAARDLGLPITVHMGGNGRESAEKGLAVLAANGLLGPQTTYIHPNYFSDDELRRIADTGGTASIAPISEAGLHIGYPATGRLRAAGIPTSLSSDSVTSGPGDMFSVMRAAYLLERARPGLEFSTRDVLRMATLEGAQVLGLGDVTGSLRPGKQADLLVLRTDSLGMSALLDPIAAVVLAAGPADIDTVLVGGEIVKRGGRLVHHRIDAVRAELLESARHVATA